MGWYTIPLFDTSNVESMAFMFEVSGIETVPLLNVSKVKNMQFMFHACSELKSYVEFTEDEVYDEVYDEGMYRECFK